MKRVFKRIKLRKLFPFLRWIPNVNRESLEKDFFAGLTGSVIVLPQGVAFALIAGLPPVYGLYTAMIPPIIAALFGSSHHLISGPTTAISIVVFATVSKVSTPGSLEYIGFVLSLTLIAGIYQLVLGFARLGAVVNFVSHSVVIGFTAGAAILIITSQVSVFLGLEVERGLSFVSTWQSIFSHWEKINPFVITVSVLSLVTALAIRIFKPKWPNLLGAMVVGCLLAWILGGEENGILLVGSIEGSLPPFNVPDVSFDTLQILGSGALAVAVLGLLEAVSIAKSVSIRTGQRIENNQEFIGQGLSNIVGSFFSCYASSGSFSRTGINYDAGGQTPLSAVFAALALTLIVLLVAPLLSFLPKAAMAGILFIVAYRLIDFVQIVRFVKAGKKEAGIMLITCLATLLVELEFAVYIGVITSLILYLMKTSRPRVISRVPDPRSRERVMISDPSLPECPQLKMIRVEGSLFFGAIDHVQKSLQMFYAKNPEQNHLLIIGNAISFIDASGAELLAQEAERLKSLGGGLYLVKINDDIHSILRRGGFLSRIGEDHVYRSKREAMEAIFAKLDRTICKSCDVKIFKECHAKPTNRLKKSVKHSRKSSSALNNGRRKTE